MANTNTQENRMIWLNGAVINVNDANINVLSPTVQFGLNVFEGIRCYWNDERETLYAFRLEDHLVRLMESADQLQIHHNYKVNDLKQAFWDAVNANQYREDIAVRQMLFVEGFGTWSSFGPAGMFVAPISKKRLSAEYQKEGLSCRISSWERIHDHSMSPRIKCGANYINSRMAMLEARQEGYDTAILLNREGTLAEATGSCVFVVKDGKLLTPTLSDSILASITRDTVIAMAKDMGLTVAEKSLKPDDLLACDEAFLCGTAMEIKPIQSVNGNIIQKCSSRNVTNDLQREYRRNVLGNGRKDWVEANK